MPLLPTHRAFVIGSRPADSVSGLRGSRSLSCYPPRNLVTPQPRTSYLQNHHRTVIRNLNPARIGQRLIDPHRPIGRRADVPVEGDVELHVRVLRSDLVHEGDALRRRSARELEPDVVAAGQA